MLSRSSDAAAPMNQRKETPSLVGGVNLLKKAEMARILRVSVRTLEHWMEGGRLPFYKLDRVVLFDLNRVMEAMSRFERKEITASRSSALLRQEARNV
jgi:excisionase family DNA binding protein